MTSAARPGGSQDVVIAQEGAGVVLKGPFNPAMFSPLWFSEAQLVGASELEDTELGLISPVETRFRLSWLEVVVTQDTFQLTTSQVEEFPRLRDAAIGVLRTLEHQPLAAIGVNREVHAQVRSSDDMHRIGDAIAPKKYWQDVLGFPAVRTVHMWGTRPDNLGGRVNVRVEPSVLFSPAVFVSVNDHYNLEQLEQVPATRDEAYGEDSLVGDPTNAKRLEAIRILSTQWEIIQDRWSSISQAVIDLAKEGAS